jgi:hypothetical protein
MITARRPADTVGTGVAPVTGLNTPGKVLTGPDLSLDAAVGAAAGLDAYGHGRRPEAQALKKRACQGVHGCAGRPLGMGTGNGQIGDRRESHGISR